MINVVCDPGTRYTKVAVTRSDTYAPILSVFPSQEADDLGLLANRVARQLKPGFFETVNLWMVGDGWVPKRTRCKSVLFGPALASVLPFQEEPVLVADCGGLRTRVLEIARGAVIRTLENERCTSGSGRFVETMSSALGIEPGQLDVCVASANVPCRVSSPCMVFAESEMISQVNAGSARADVLAGVVAHAVEKVASLVSRASPAGRVLLVGGGLARLQAFRDGLALSLPATRVVVPSCDPMFLNCLAGLEYVSKVPPSSSGVLNAASWSAGHGA